MRRDDDQGSKADLDPREPADIVAAHEQLVARGVAVSEVTAIDGDASRVARGGAALDNVGFVFFEDPDGNGWAVQQITSRA